MAAPVLQLPVKFLRSATAGRRPGDGNFRPLTDGDFFINTQDKVACYLNAAGGMITMPFDATLLAAALDSRLRVDAAQGLLGPAQLLGRQNLGSLGAGTLTKIANYPIVAADAGRLFVFGAAGVTLSLPAIAAVPDGFVVAVRSPQAVNAVGILAAAGADTIDNGLATLRVLPGQHFLLMSDGTGWRSFGRSNRVLVGRAVGTGGTGATFTLPAGYEAFELQYAVALNTQGQLGFTLSYDGGNTYQSAAGTWNNAVTYAGGGSTSAGYEGPAGFATLTATVNVAAYYGAMGTARINMGNPGNQVQFYTATVASATAAAEAVTNTGYTATTNRPTNISIAPTSGTLAFLDFQLYGLASQ